MTAIEIARRLAELGDTEKACQAYTLAIHQAQEPAEELEAAVYILQNGGDYKISYSAFVDLYGRGQFQEDCLAILTQAFYEPNVRLQKKRYEKNCKLLEKYPYLFRRDFIDFESLPIRFYPFDDNSYLPFCLEQAQFRGHIKPKDTVISRNFFKDLEKPILAQEVFSQYELEYLRDNVRRSEDVARENHVYLAYPDWSEFCSYLQILDMRPLLVDKKVVFLIGDEIEQYPIDFKERFGIDYSTYTLQPIGIWELDRLIWHTQLATHNGGDFFNEIFDGHPNLISAPSLILKDIEEQIKEVRQVIKESKNVKEAHAKLPKLSMNILKGLYARGTFSDKELLLVLYFYSDEISGDTDWSSRIVPALFFQPHFTNLNYSIRTHPEGEITLYSKQYEEIKESPIFREFKYIKAFTPMRRPTTSYGATIRFLRWEEIQKELSEHDAEKDEDDGKLVIWNMPDELTNRTLNRSFMIDPQDRLYRDSVLVRFEDGKLNPKATFTALAAFLDLPYTESMTYCSLYGKRDPESLKGNDLGFSSAAIYRTYDEYANDAERCFLEYVLRDAYEYYGYDLHYWDGSPMDEERMEELVGKFETLDRFIQENKHDLFWQMKVSQNGQAVDPQLQEEIREKLLAGNMREIRENRTTIAKLLMGRPRFVNKKGQPLRMMPKLELDPALLEQPMYH